MKPKKGGTDINSFKLFSLIAIALLVTLISFKVMIAIQNKDKKPTESKPKTLGAVYYKVPRTRFQIIFENVVLIAFGIFVILSGLRMSEYAKYGAFYDDSWKQADVEEHFIITTDDTIALTEIYESDPQAFNFDSWNVVIIRFGCKECEMLNPEILALQEQGYYLIYSRSELGKTFVEHYNVTAVPCVITGGNPKYYDLSTKTIIEP